MKTFAYLALIGFTSSFNISPKMSNQEKLFISSAMHEDSLVQVEESKIMEELKGFGGWHASMEEFPGTVNQYGDWYGAYNRTIPEVFQGDSADEGSYPIDKFT
tara:strand:+ start:81 stop:389 length:309 start_codon:yes stop_codon:yes gene_type:complete